jgi:hypothetical protein
MNAFSLLIQQIHFCTELDRSCGGSVGTETRMDDRGSIPERDNDGFFLLFATASRPALEPTQLPYLKNTGGCYTGVKRPACEADNSYPPSAEAKNAWS